MMDLTDPDIYPSYQAIFLLAGLMRLYG